MTIEELTIKIMKECEADGEAVTKEEAEEMARMELKDKKNRRYETSDTPKEKKTKERKVDGDKKRILTNIKTLIEGMQLNNNEYNNVIIKTETELSFNYNNNSYTLKLIKHRPSKK